jgi:hypothetical protein
MSLDLMGVDASAHGDGEALKKATQKLLLGGIVGGVLGGVGGALLWPAHRIAGFFLSSVFIGAPMGYGVGMYLASRDLPVGNRSGQRELPLTQPQAQAKPDPNLWATVAARPAVVPKPAEPMQPLNLSAMVGKRRR